MFYYLLLMMTNRGFFYNQYKSYTKFIESKFTFLLLNKLQLISNKYNK